VKLKIDFAVAHLVQKSKYSPPKRVKGKIMRAQLRNYLFEMALLSAPLLTAANVKAGPVLNDWFALGSGCRAKSNLPGNVYMKNLGRDHLHPDIYRVEFTFQDLNLKGDSAPQSVLIFARECAIRLNINPPKNRKLVSLRARTEVVTNKDKGIDLNTDSELILGSISLASTKNTAGHQTLVQNTIEKIELASDGTTGSVMPNLGCGEAKIAGFNYSWIAKRQSPDLTNMSVNLGKGKNLILEATLAACDAQN
jgi:hypothetical protein